MSGIGLLNEKALHASLREWYARPGDRFEVPVDGFVVDIVRGEVLIEVQTGNFSAVRSKLETLVRSHPVRLLYPIAVEKWILRSNEDGERAIRRRKSPKRGRVEDLFGEVVHIPRLMAHPGFALEVLMIREEQARRYGDRRNRPRKGWVLEERQLIEVVDRKVFAEPESWLALLPGGLEAFTSRDLAETLGIGLDLAQKMTYSFRQAGLLELTGKRGRSHLYFREALR